MLSVLFILPVGGGSGGAHSVMQEADAMRRLGVEVRIAANANNAVKLRSSYVDLPYIINHIHGYESIQQLSQLISEFDPAVVVATTNQSVHVLASAIKIGSPRTNARYAYYVQDYEPFFYEKGTDDWLVAYSSYGLIPGMIHFAKTRWLQEVVEENHGVQVYKVEPSIDHDVYYPDFGTMSAGRDRLNIAAMLRPSTPRRAPKRTVRILNMIGKKYAGRVSCFSFGCILEDYPLLGLNLDSCKHLGVLRREEVGDLFRSIDLFIDLSDFQAFGRTAIEAMSCGALAIVPAHGGTYEYAVDGKNSFVVDVRNDELIERAIDEFVALHPSERLSMSLSAVSSGYAFSPERAALSEIALFAGV